MQKDIEAQNIATKHAMLRRINVSALAIWQSREKKTVGKIATKRKTHRDILLSVPALSTRK